MSLTQTSGVFAGVHEDGINDFVTAFFNSRPRYLRWGSPAFVPATSISETRIPAIPPFNIEYLVELEQPRLDLYPDTFGFGLPPGRNQFSLEIKVKLTVGCQSKPRDPKDDNIPRVEPISTDLVLCARGHFERQASELVLIVDDVVVKDIRPESLGVVLSCMLRMIVQEMLRDLRIPYRSVFIGIGTLAPVGGITIDNDTASAFANIV